MNRGIRRMIRKTIPMSVYATCLLLGIGSIFMTSALAATAGEIDAGADAALDRFKQDVKGGKEFLQAAKGALVFRRVYEAGFILGGEYGQGALRIGAETVDYYNIIAGSLGFQIGVQAKTIILVFMQDQALENFRASSGWKVGVDGSVALITIGAGEVVDSNSIKDPIVAFVFDNKGLMFNISLEGAKFTKIDR
jgi:lipid-binding SYLF domain-containing protein